jgi:hypothetical protein
MTAPSRTARTLGIAAKRRQATPAVAPVASGYEREPRAGLARAFRRPESTICTEGDL